jgi:hypothetical protein
MKTMLARVPRGEFDAPQVARKAAPKARENFGGDALFTGRLQLGVAV